jgi:hypothetical protein
MSYVATLYKLNFTPRRSIVISLLQAFSFTLLILGVAGICLYTIITAIYALLSKLDLRNGSKKSAEEIVPKYVLRLGGISFIIFISGFLGCVLLIGSNMIFK